jgi:hypothetical protein
MASTVHWFGYIGPLEHSIVVPERNLQIPLKLRGTVKYFNTRKLTEYELSNEQEFPQIHQHGTHMMNCWGKKKID